jgi:oxygen-independent coproporphyrinogen-3 oxidase
MAAAIEKEVVLQKEYLGKERIDTIYFGGGTPSLLSKDELDGILRVIKDHHDVNPGAEVTLEANPDDLTVQKLDELRNLGVNRLSLGIQSFRDDILTFFNRAHNSAEASTCIEDARKAGFDNISIDLIYGVPGQDNDALREGIDHAMQFRPEHISAYSLTIEEKTVFGKWKSANKLVPMDEGIVADQFEILSDVLTQRGYDHYEISNYSLPGFASRHNSSYWNGTKYLGLGPSAHSYDGPTRQFNVANNAAYIRRVESNEVLYEREVLSESDKVNEFFLIGLRTSAGCDLNKLQVKLTGDQQKYINELVTLGKVTFANGVLKLTNKGKLLADKIASDLFVSGE